MKPKSWLVISVVIVVMLGAGNFIGYWFFSRAKEPAPVQVEAKLDASNAVRMAALDRRDKALEALRVEDYDKAISNLEAAQTLDPTLNEIPKFIEVAQKLKAAREAKSSEEKPEEKIAEAPVHRQPEPVAEAKVAHVEKREASPKIDARAKAREQAREREKEREPKKVVEQRAEVAPGVLLVTTNPTKLLIEVDGKARDLSPARIEVTPGAHSVRIIDGERAVYSKEIDLDAGEVFALNETFGPAQNAPAATEEKPKIAAVTASRDSLEGDGKLDLVRLIDREPSNTVANKELAPASQVQGVTQSPSTLTPSAPNAPPRVLVFLPGKQKGSVESELSAKMAGVDVKVATRASELKELTRTGPVDAILATPSVLRQYGLKPQLNGVAAKETRYIAASFKPGLSKDSLASGTIAAVDELGKKETTELVTRLLGTTKKVKLRRVTKLEDLISSLQVKLADAILVRDTDLAEIKSKTQQQLHVLELSEKVDALAVGFVDGSRRAVVERAVRALDAEMRADLGVVRWAE